MVFETLASGRDADAYGVPHWCLKRIVYTSEIKWRTLLDFEDVEVICLQRICPLVWFILNGWRASCARVPEGALYTVRDLESPPRVVPSCSSTQDAAGSTSAEMRCSSC